MPSVFMADINQGLTPMARNVVVVVGILSGGEGNAYVEKTVDGRQLDLDIVVKVVW